MNDSRGVPLTIGDIVVASGTGRYHDLHEWVVTRFTATRITMLRLDQLKEYQDKNKILIDDMSLNDAVREINGWYNKSRYPRMCAKVDTLDEWNKRGQKAI